MKMLTKSFLGLIAAALLLAVPSRATTTAITVQKVVKGGVSTTNYTESSTPAIVKADTYTFTNDGRTFIHFAKTGANAATIRFFSQATSQGLAVADQTLSVAASTGDVFAGPFPASIFNDASGNVSFVVSDDNGLSFSILRLGQ